MFNLFKKKSKEPPKPILDTSNLATKEDFYRMQRQLKQTKKELILASLSPRSRERLLKYMEQKKAKGKR